VPPPPPPAHWQFPIKGERIEVEVSLGDTTAWVTAEVLTILFDGTFQARIELPDLSDRWEDWFTWQEEGTEWRRREEWKSRPPPKKWKWLNEGDRVEVEIRVGEGDEAAGAWVTAEVLTVLIDGTFQARIELPDGSDQWEDWFSWQEEGTDWRRRAQQPRAAPLSGAVLSPIKKQRLGSDDQLDSNGSCGEKAME
jgi:hypothetical protein